MTSKSIEDLEKQVVAFLGVKPESIGKTQARQNFLPLVDKLSRSVSAVRITEHDKPVAMLLSYNHWLALVSKIAMLSKKDLLTGKRPNLIGSIELIGDLEAGSQFAAEVFTLSIKKSAEKL